MQANIHGKDHRQAGNEVEEHSSWQSAGTAPPQASYPFEMNEGQILLLRAFCLSFPNASHANSNFLIFSLYNQNM